MVENERAADLLTETLQQLGYDVTHRHDNLVFTSKNQFILQQSDNPLLFDLYFNVALDECEAAGLMAHVQAAGLENSLLIAYKGAYSMTEDDDQTLSVEFFDLAAD